LGFIGHLSQLPFNMIAAWYMCFKDVKLKVCVRRNTFMKICPN
jgi:hypothetical protein